MSSASWFDPSNFRHLRLALKISLNVMANAVLRLRHPLVFTVRCRTVAKVLSMGLEVRMWFQCSAGNHVARPASSPLVELRAAPGPRFAVASWCPNGGS